MKILADATLPHLNDLFADFFTLTTYSNDQQLTSMLRDYDILICRSTLKVSAALLKHTSIQCVATASSGIDHIDSNYLNQHGIRLLDAKGCNAIAVADYVIATIALLHQEKQIVGGKAGVIGVGAVGSQVAIRLSALGYEVICYDPYKALIDQTTAYCDWQELITCDLLCLHANLHDNLPYPSRNLLNKKFLAQLKPYTILINAARGGIINEAALVNNQTPLIYCTDVYCNEPQINGQIINFAKICTPHIAGHSIEAKIAAITQISQQLHAYYQVAMPLTAQRAVSGPSLLPMPHWQENILALYNPRTETDFLKIATNKKDAFLSLRQAHRTRHNFSYYEMGQLSRYTKSLLGY